MKYAPDAARIEHHRQQMMEMYRKAVSSSPADTEEEDWLDSRYPEPDIQRDKAVLAQLPPSAQPTDTPTFTGYLRVYAFTGNGAEPITGARAIITRINEDDQTVYANLLTDRDGFTPVVALPTVDPALTLQPGASQPYVTYSVRVTADGFQAVEHRNIPIYGNNYVTQPVAMLPILPGQDTSDTQEFTSGGPTNL